MDKDEAYRIWQHWERKLSDASNAYRDATEALLEAESKINEAIIARDAAKPNLIGSPSW